MGSFPLIFANFHRYQDGDVINLRKFEYFYDFLDIHELREIGFNFQFNIISNSYKSKIYIHL